MTTGSPGRQAGPDWKGYLSRLRAPREPRLTDPTRHERSSALATLVSTILVLSLMAILSRLIFLITGFSGSSLRYIIAPFVLFFLSILLSARYVRWLYKLPSFSDALGYLLGSLFGLTVPALTITREMRKQDGRYSLMDAIGGPGYLTVGAGCVAALERFNDAPEIRGPGKYRLLPFQRVKDVLRLGELSGEIEHITTFSKDGISVEARGVRFTYRMMQRPPLEVGEAEVEESKPLYNFSRSGALRAFYNRTVLPDGQLSTWHSAVENVVKGVITGYIQTHTVDQITAPGHDADPRADIKAKMSSEETQKRFHSCGAELIWYDIGNFTVPDIDIDRQRVRNWQARWEGHADVQRTYVEAQRIKHQELARAEAQAEMLMSIVHALGDIGVEGDARRNLRKIIMLRTAQILDAVTEEYRQSGAPALEDESGSS